MFLGYWSFRSRLKKTETNGVGRSMKIPITTSGYSLSCCTKTNSTFRVSSGITSQETHMRWVRKEQLLGTDLESSERLEFLMTDCTTGLKGPSIGDIVSQVVDLELERTLLNLSFIGAHRLSWRRVGTLVGPFPWMMTGRVSCSRFLARTLPSSNFSTTSSVNTKMSNSFPSLVWTSLPAGASFVNM